MSLRYTKYEDICLKVGSKITLNSLNAALKKLIENDNSLIPENSIVPKIWECKWFNDKTMPGYSKGDAVWINTEPLDSFTAARYQNILNYLLQNSFYRTKVEALQKVNDTAKLFALCRDMVQTGKLYYIGDITQPVQLKISTADDNKDPPLDTSSKWKNFFIITDDDTNMQKFLQILTQQTNELMHLHVETYHLPETFPIENYLLRDLANIDQNKVQKCKSIKYRSNYQGFDYILMTVRKKYDGKSQKWFRIWNSGYLEHGGTIDLDANSLPENDEKTDCTYTVHLDWSYGPLLSNVAPTYEYQNIDFRDSYCTTLSSDFDVGGGDGSVKVEYDLKDMISLKTRYVVSLTPGIKSSQNPYSTLSFPEKLNIYESNAVNSIDNNSFMFYFQPSDGNGLPNSLYTYYCSGFSTTMFDRIRKQAAEANQTEIEPSHRAACKCK